MEIKKEKWPQAVVSTATHDVRKMRKLLREGRLPFEVSDQARKMLLATSLHSAPGRAEYYAMPSCSFDKLDTIELVKKIMEQRDLRDVSTGFIAWITQRRERFSQFFAQDAKCLLLMHRPLLGCRFAFMHIEEKDGFGACVLSHVPHSDKDILGINGKGYYYLVADK